MGEAVIRPADADGIREAGALIRAGRLVAFPTETVYGLGADATDDRAVARIFEAKRRPRFNPLIVHVSGLAEAKRLVRFEKPAPALAEAFWPGGLTLVLTRAPACPVSLLAGAGLDTLAVRAPSHPVAQALLAAAGVPIAAPSANRAGAVSPTTAAHVAQSLGGAVDLILDGGACPVGIESTIVACAGGAARLLRPGAVTVEAVEAVIGPLAAPAAHGGPEAPGMLESHYAPVLPLRLDASEARPGEALLGFGPHPGADLNLSPSGDLREAAANLFAMLRALDRPAFAAIAVMPIPDAGLGRAINDRLRRAAAPRS